MPDKPLLIFSRSSEVSHRSKKGGGPGNYKFPSLSAQKARIQPKLTQLQESFEHKRLFIQQNMEGFVPEMVLVLEIVGTITEFFNVIKKIPEMEWLAEFEEDYIEPDEYFQDISDREKPLGGRLYMIMTNQQAMRQMVSLWNRYKQGRDFEWGMGRWKLLFTQLRDIRFWNLEDRLRETGFEKLLQESRENHLEQIKFEVELWFRKDSNIRNRVIEQIRSLLDEYSGRVISECTIEEICYSAILVEAPITCFDDLTGNSDVELLQFDQIMFFRPVGQVIVGVNEQEPVEENIVMTTTHASENLPIAALLDGIPLQNHQMLAEHLIVDDPDSFEEDYEATSRIHGTAMASLILYGDLNEANSKLLKNKIYVRPILKPNQFSSNNPKEEIIPRDCLPIDLVHRALKRMFERDGENEAIAPTVKIINLSVADLSKAFNLSVSPWARLLDWLTVKYSVLFIVSIGNCSDDIILDLPRNELNSLSPADLEREVQKSIFNNFRNRRILSPSESINAISVGASHFDYSSIAHIDGLINVYQSNLIPSPINRNGFGFRRSVKPDLLMPGGRQLLRERLGNTHANATLQISRSMPLGQKVACPGLAGSLNSYRSTTGTSNATANATRLACQLYEELIELGSLDGYISLQSEIFHILLKALMVHGASWADAHVILEEVLSGRYDIDKVKEIISCFFGYGFVNVNRLFNCEAYRTTLIGTDELRKDEAHSYVLPLPNSLNGIDCWKRLTLTLAWNSPVNMNHNKYRKAALWFEKPDDILKLNRIESQWQQTQRGTVQHEIYEGSRAVSFERNSDLNIKVNCREDAGKLTESIKYAFIATIEVKDEIDINIYDEIRTRIRAEVRV